MKPEETEKKYQTQKGFTPYHFSREKSIHQKKATKSGTGFTLIEMMVAIAVFCIIIGAVFGLFISGLRGQRNALASQRLLDQTSYDFEYMSRALRMAKKDTAGACISSGFNYQIVNSALRFINHLENDDCQEFFLEGEQLKQKKNNLAETLELTSPKLKITSLNFSFQGESQGDNLQPKVTISLTIKGRGQRIEEQPAIMIQTTISQRNLDIQTF